MGVTLSAPTRSGMAGTWCMHRSDAHHITSVFVAFSLAFQLQAVASHPRRCVVDTGRHGILKTCWILCITEAIHLCRPHTDGLEDCVRPPVGWGLQCIKETRSVQGPSLEVHHRWRLTTWSRKFLKSRNQWKKHQSVMQTISGISNGWSNRRNVVGLKEEFRL